jgi:hypothetical protein
MEADISIWRKPGHFYFALTRGETRGESECGESEERVREWTRGVSGGESGCDPPGAPVARCTSGYGDSKIRPLSPIYTRGRNESL